MSKIGVISDVHGNYFALETVVNSLMAEGCNKIICLGDVCGYYSMVNECIDLLRANGVTTLKGNHESYVLGEASCPRSRSVRTCIEYQQGIITEDNLDWCRQLPLFIEEGALLAFHGGLHDPLDEYTMIFDFHQAHMRYPNASFFLSGHTHCPSFQSGLGLRYGNPGSVGQPRDHDPRAAYLIIDDDTASFRRIEYPIENTIAAMQDAGFASHFYDNLTFGCKIGDPVIDKERGND